LGYSEKVRAAAGDWWLKNSDAMDKLSDQSDGSDTGTLQPPVTVKKADGPMATAYTGRVDVSRGGSRVQPQEVDMKRLLICSACLSFALSCCPFAKAAESPEASQIVVSPEKYVGRQVTITVQFMKINNRFLGWEEQANLKQERLIKFNAAPLGEIACYADKSPDNEKTIGGLKKGQEIEITGTMREYDMEARVKGEKRTVTRKVKGPEIHAFIVKKIESVGEAPTGPAGGMKMRRGMRGQ
jgi:hypothetical protein